MRHVVPLLRILKRHGLTEVGRNWFRPTDTVLSSEPIEAQAELLALGTNVAHLLGPRQSSEAGQIFLSFSDGFGSDAGQLNSLVVAAADSNRSKLEAAAMATTRWRAISADAITVSDHFAEPAAAAVRLPLLWGRGRIVGFDMYRTSLPTSLFYE